MKESLKVLQECAEMQAKKSQDYQSDGSNVTQSMHYRRGVDTIHDVILGKVEGTNFDDSILVGHSTTGTLNSAQDNTGVGVRALKAITSGDQNNFFNENRIVFAKKANFS